MVYYQIIARKMINQVEIDIRLEIIRIYIQVQMRLNKRTINDYIINNILNGIFTIWSITSNLQ